MNPAAGRMRLLLLPALAASLVSLPAVGSRLQWDDLVLIQQDGFVHSLANLGAAFGRSFWAGASGSGNAYDYYRPITAVSYMLTWAIAGATPWVYHLFNVLVYACTAGLLAVRVAELGAGAGAGLAAGLLFATFPMHHENVDFVSGRTDLLAGLFLLLALGPLARLRDSGEGLSGRLAWVMVCVACAALSKEVAYVAPACAVLFEWAGGWRPRAAVRIAAVILPVLLVAWTQHEVLASRVHSPLPGAPAMLTALLLGTRSLLLPWPAHLDRYLPEHLAWAPLPVLLAWTAFVGVILVFASGRGERAAWLCVWWLMLPGSVSGMPADRMLYLPSMVFVPWAAWKLSHLPWPRAARAALCGLAVLACGVGLAWMGRAWSNPGEYFETQVAESPADPAPREHLAEAYRQLASEPGISEAARRDWLLRIDRQLAACTRLDPRRTAAWFSLGRNDVELGRDSLALIALGQGLQLVEDDQARIVQAEALVRLGRYAEAESACVLSLATDTGKADADRWATLGWIRFKLRRDAQSIEATDEALRRNPGLLYAAYNRALALGSLGRLEESKAAYRQAMRRDMDGAAAAAGLRDIDDTARQRGAAGLAIARVFLAAAGIGPAETGALKAALLPALRQVLSGCPSIRDVAAGPGPARAHAAGGASP